MIGNIKSTKLGFTLIEVIVSVAIFAVIILTSSQIFQSVVDTQLEGFSEQALQDDVRYFLEVFNREARGAIKNVTSTIPICNVAQGYTYYTNTSNDELYFKNALGQCVVYSTNFDLNNVNRLYLERDGLGDYLSSDSIDIESLKFVLSDSPIVKSLITLNLKFKSNIDPNLDSLNIQTSVNPYYYAQ